MTTIEFWLAIGFGALGAAEILIAWIDPTPYGGKEGDK